ncbi:MAG: beta-ketoacyl synthase N-terminal-like domain-containing protein [Anaerolineaceae bacterium]|jgi:acetyl-CoA acetyltransferase|nr:beta-ketoacyl synthase N-terminal-like domain-containing protein [Anaerolineaceae bacterium]
MTKKLSRGVAVVGVGMSKFGAFPDKTSRDLFVEAFQELRKSVQKGFDPKDIEAFYMGNFSSDHFENQAHLAPIVASWVGISPVASTRIEDACASSGVALREGVLAIASGAVDMVLVGGLEKMTDLPGAKVTDTLALAADSMFEIPAGFTFPGFYAAMATAFIDKYNADPDALLRVGIKNHENGALNEKAQFNQTIKDVMIGKQRKAEQKGLPIPQWQDEMAFLKDPKANLMIAWPLRLFDCSPVSDGAAAVLLVSEELAANFTDEPIFIVGSGQASDGALAERDSLSEIPAAAKAAQRAYEMAGVTPEEIDFAEVHDCFTIAEIMATEDLGFFPRGEGWKAAMQGQTARDGNLPINTSGGLKSKGHPVGASGVGQVVEIWKQLHGLAGERQLRGNLRYALTHNVGGTGQTCVVHIFEKRN